MTAERRHFGDTAEFAAAVEQLVDPLSDPLPGRTAAVPAAAPAATPAPAAEPGPQAAEAPQPGSPWFRPHQEATPAPEPEPVRPEPVQTRPEPVQPQPQPRPQSQQPQPEPVQPQPRPQQPRPQPRAPETPYDREAARRRAAGAPGDTAAMPLFVPTPEASSPTPSPAPAPPRPQPPDPAPAAAPGVPPEGGRAARRKAAQEAAKRGGRGRRAAGAGKPATEPREAAGSPVNGPANGPGDAPAERPPLSRVEARRAAKAAKESPAVIASRVLGEIFITMGVLMLLFVTYQLWWTNVLAHQEAGGTAKNLEKQWDGSSSSQRDPGTFSPGEGFAIIYLPKLDVKAPIAEGTDKHKVLDKGMVGHYDGKLETAMPWDKQGNFALAAHRNTHGEPFRYINKLAKGDKVVVETESTYYTYEITSMLPSTSPSNTSVITPVPTGSGFTKAGRYITLTTCTPEFTSKYRLIVWGKMVEERPRSKGKPDALVE